MIRTKLILLFFSLYLVNSGIVWAQQTQNPVTSENLMLRDVTILASDSMQGREAGTYGEQMASAYISEQMREIGLLPKGNKDGSYLSEFRMSFPVIFKEAELKINDIEFKHVEEFGATDLSAPGTITAQLFNPHKRMGEAAYTYDNEYKNTDINGKIVVIDIATNKSINENSEILKEIISRVKTATGKGAVGIILHNSSNKTTENLLFGSPFTESLNVPVIYIAKLPFNKIRKIKTADCTLSVVIDRTISKPANVIGWIDRKSAKTVVIGAHYDHVGVKPGKPEEDRPPQVYNGADDNASGTAALLDLARWAEGNKNLKYNYIFAAFSAEEKGLFGSKAFCSLPWVNNENIVYMLNMDMVGRLGCQGDTINALGVASSPVWEPLLDTLRHPDFSIKKINGAPAFSDHAPFLKKNIPIIYFTSGLHPEYHTPKDDSELINFVGMSEIVAYIRHFICSAEALPEIPFHKINPLQNTKAYIQTF